MFFNITKIKIIIGTNIVNSTPFNKNTIDKFNKMYAELRDQMAAEADTDDEDDGGDAN